MYDELVKRIWECASGECFNCSQYTETTNASVCSKELMKQAADAIEELLKAAKVDSIPASDVRHVVVCRDCKHNMANIPNFQDGININENWNACQLTELYDSVKPDDFCSHGVKREENK